MDAYDDPVHAQSRGMLVLSEMLYPGCHATINSRPTTIYRAGAGLRSIIVPSGDSKIILDYTPCSIYLGVRSIWAGFVKLLALLGILAAHRLK